MEGGGGGGGNKKKKVKRKINLFYFQRHFNLI